METVFELSSGYGTWERYPYYRSRTSFPKAAPGWVDGIYYPREKQEELSGRAPFEFHEDYIPLASRVWKETEETGFGICSYEETEIIHIPLENGNYDIRVTFANPTGEAYHARIKVNGIVKAGDVLVGEEEGTAAFSFCVIKGELALKLLPVSLAVTREGAEEKTVYLKQIAIRKIPRKEKGDRPAIFLASDSTVQVYSKEYAPQTGWGQVFPGYFREIKMENRAIGGRSARSFLEEGRLDEILSEVRPGDYVLVQFGHNDATAARPNRYIPEESFAEYLQYYIDGVKQRGAVCVLVTPVARRNCEEEGGAFSISFPGYRKVMLALAAEQKLPLLDLGKATTEYLKQIGAEESKKLFLWTEKGEFPESNYREGVTDNTHLQYRGAEAFAGIAARLVAEYHEDDQLDRIKAYLK